VAYPWESPSIPDVGDDGWIDPIATSDLVHNALALSAGDVLPVGEGSYGVMTWFDVDAAGRKVRVSEGEWATGFVETPQAALDCLANEGVPTAGFTFRALRVRYRTERRSGVAKPGWLRMRITCFVRPDPDTPDQAIHPPSQIECLIADFQEQFQGE
jgi:hypothetical protein